MERTNLDVGRRIRRQREALGLSLRALAKQCGLSTNAISLIERGENSPTVSSLHVLATALGVSITDFFEDAEARQAIIVVRPETRLRSEANGITLESLGIGLPHQHLEPFLVTLSAGAGNADQPVRHGGEEFVYCLAGIVEYRIADQAYILEPGNSLLFDASLPHSFRNLREALARFMLVFYADAGNHLARRLHLEAPSEPEDDAESPLAT